MVGISGFIESAKRVLMVSKKPDWREYRTMAKITGAGILLIAAIGLVVTLIFRLLNLGM